MEVCIKASKMDRFQRGVTIYIEVTVGDLCQVVALVEYMVVWGNSDGPVFLFSNGDYLTRNHFVAQLQQALAVARVDCMLYAGHRFSIAVATTASMCGIQDWVIKTLSVIGRTVLTQFKSGLSFPSTLLAVSQTLTSSYLISNTVV